MKKLLLVLFCISFIMSCTQLCNTGRSAADKIALAMQSRWSCNYDVTYKFFSSPVDKYICKDEAKFTIPAELLKGACTVATNVLAILAADAIANKFQCDVAKVTADLKTSSNVCSLLSLI